MLKATVALAPLLAVLILVPAPAAGADAASASLCYNYLFVHDYQWHFLCVDPKDASCPVYTVQSNHPDYPRGEPECVVDAPLAGTPLATEAPRCYQWGQDLDYTHYVCHDLADRTCMVYLLTTGDPVPRKTCLVGIPGVDFGTGCILIGQGLEHSYHLCYAPGDLRCPVYTERRGGSGDPSRTCVGSA